jgi:hypothetical protein
MTVIRIRTLLLAAIALGMVLTAGCIPPVPIYSDPGLASLRMDKITVLPAVDRRVDKSSKVDLEGGVRGRVVRSLKRKGYTVEAPQTFSGAREIPNAEVAEMETQELAGLGPQDARYLFVVYLDDACGVTAFGTSYKTEATGLLIEKSSAKVLWRDKAVTTDGITCWCIMAGINRGSVMQRCFYRMMASFPKHSDAS